MKEDRFDDPTCWDRTTLEADQKKLEGLERRVKLYLLDIDRRYKVNDSSELHCVG